MSEGKTIHDLQIERYAGEAAKEIQRLRAQLAESESKCAKMREILVARDEEARSAFEFFRLNLPACDGECAPEGSCITERCLRCYAKYCAKHRGRNRIDEILESEE